MQKSFGLRLTVICAMMTALTVVLNRFGSIHTDGWTIGFSFVPVAMTAILYGPAAAAAVGGVADLVGALLFPFGPYFPGFTATAALMGAVYGWFLYKKNPVRLVPHILPATLINSILLGLLVNTLWVSILYGSRTYWGWFVYRLPEYAVLIPLNLILIPVLVQLARRVKPYRKEEA
ncbi:MAG: folate family ECF transporter S component [Ruminococcaceae bacterium]|jgi:ECF transporter S component (folate family)|nr:folate family ECF transporter S component [Oscillospiraceae bacterium]